MKPFLHVHFPICRLKSPKRASERQGKRLTRIAYGGTKINANDYPAFNLTFSTANDDNLPLSGQ
ncbi:hypothetical protein CKQ54_05270 [Rahnella variigena]|jgi:hypothetical protein|uniref:Uncharacterized protein n=1 Tax=Rahnella variigena TaxID=574964 RepID=A0ABX9PUD1_9GAMM|nr:hypothetical protein D6D38_10435 [Rahnella variigena]RKF67821.1 hypothetical protein CKQ54_05270 [Rahnella variigena]